MEETQIRQMLPIGTLLKHGEYRVARYIASGGFGNTYEVEHVRLGKHLALKEFFMRGINQREGTRVSVSMEDNRQTFNQMREKFYKEAQRLASMENAHIVEVNDFFEENETAYYVMKLIDGESLATKMKRTGQPLAESEVRGILPQVLSALKYVHAQGLYHLDLKPGNMMINGEGHCWVIDFGASKQLSAQESMTLSTSTGLCYTPGYAPSEQINGNTKRIGPWTDFYALGATLYNLLTNQQPPSSDDIMDEGTSAFVFPATVSNEMRQLIMRMMKQPTSQRPQSVAEIEQLLKPQSVTKQEEQSETKHHQQSREHSQPTQVAQKQSQSQPTRLAVQKSKRSSTWLWFWGVAGILVALFIGMLVRMSDKTPVIVPTESAVENNTEETVVVDDSVLQNLVNNMVRVEGGTFQMGGDDDEAYDDEVPVHSVSVSTFYIGKYEVTQEEWEAIMETNPSNFKVSDRPVVNIRWDDCQTFITKLNEKTGLQFRLPTEAEWEYAARGGKNHDACLYSGGDSIGSVAWYSENSGATSHVVGLKTPNSLGLYDMSGNVCEWCQDWYDADYYSKSPFSNPRNDTELSFHVFRGGSWCSAADDSRVSYRGYIPDYIVGWLGFRLAR